MLEKYKSPGSDEISAELIQAGGETLIFAINSIWNREELLSVERVYCCISSQKGRQN
jgi:hypothetical protein